jgi:DNA-binding IclR family transcriptional regulator
VTALGLASWPVIGSACAGCCGSETAFHRVARSLVGDDSEMVQLRGLPGTELGSVGKGGCSQTVRFVSSLGTRLAAPTTSLGGALRSCHSEQGLQELYDGRLDEMAPNSYALLDSLIENVQRGREHPWAHDTEKTAIGP